MQVIWQNHSILYLGTNRRLTRYINMSITPPKSLMTAVGVKKRPSAIIFRLSSMLMNITNTYSAIWNGQKAVWLPWMQKLQVSFSPLSREVRYLQSRCVHHSSKGGFEHHGDAGADGYDDHDPVQISHQAQQVTAEDQTKVRNANPLGKVAKSQRWCFCESTNVDWHF